MYAIVEIAGQQFKVSKDQKIFVHRLDESEGSEVIFDKVLLIDQNGAITLGAPAIDGASVQAKVLRHVKGDKVIVFKKKRRKGYKVKNGHRQFFTEIQISEILATGGKKAPAKESKPKTKKEQEKKANDGQFGLVDNDRFEELKKRLREKLNQLNMGIDPDILASRLAVGNNGAIE